MRRITKIMFVTIFICCVAIFLMGIYVVNIENVKVKNIKQAYLKETEYNSAFIRYYCLAEEILQNDSVNYSTFLEFNQVKDKIDSLLKTEEFEDF